jgi:hypothetical protein
MARTLGLTWFVAVVHSVKLWEALDRSTMNVQPV